MAGLAYPLTSDDGAIICQIDGAKTHSIAVHIKKYHAADWTVERYKAEFPEAPLLSAAAIKKLSDRAAKPKEEPVAPNSGIVRRAFHEVFELGAAKAAMNAKGDPIMITCFADLDDESRAFVPDVDPNYVFDIELTKTAIMALELGKTAYFWGFHGTGKSSAWEQVHARTGRPLVRVQHTINTEESHIVGEKTVEDGNVRFVLGPLPMAMLNGWTYLADEYDFALPHVTSVYQAVMEGKALVIKEAPPELRVIRPHPNFRLVGTGNTNGSGDETGLYQGTQLGNAANYSRWAITEQVNYMTAKVEAIVVANQSGIEKADADKIVSFANEVRKAYEAQRVGATVSPRELINAGQLGLARGGNWRKGLEQAFLNRLGRNDKDVIGGFAQRIFG